MPRPEKCPTGWCDCNSCRFWLNEDCKVKRKFHFSLKLDYDIEADTKEEAVDKVMELIRRDAIIYIDEGELEEVKVSSERR